MTTKYTNYRFFKVVMVLLLISNTVLAQNSCFTVNPIQGLSFTESGGMKSRTFSHSCSSGTFSIYVPPTVSEWVSADVTGSIITITVQPNSLGSRSIGLSLLYNGSTTNAGILIEQDGNANPPCTASLWYPDNNLDGQGDPYEDPVSACVKPYGNWTLTPYGGGPNVENYNWIATKAYNLNNTLQTSSKAYFDELGKPLQTQSWNVKTDSIWATQQLYDVQGRNILQTFSAPIGTGTNFTYKNGFIKQANNSSDYASNNYEGVKAENPDSVGNSINTLGWYYSENNNHEPYQDVTQYPFAKQVYSTLMPGNVLRNLGGNKVDTNRDGDIDQNDSWAQVYSFSMLASQELSQNVAFGELKYNNFEIIKTVSRDVHGVENVGFTDSEGRTLATARSGSTSARTMQIDIPEQGYVDIHVPVGDNLGFTVTTNGNVVTVYNLITETIVTPSSGLPNGFYRVTLNDPDNYDLSNPVRINYHENYYDYSLNEYDEANRLIASYQPLNKLKTEYQYDTEGQFIYTKSPDEGEAWFKYREDGQIRFSQNSKQKLVNEFSYTNYDAYGRAIESGVLVSTAFNTADPDNAVLPSGTKKEVQTTFYDAVNTTELNTLPVAYRNPSFLASNVSKTTNEQSTTYYSYDIYGRLQWLVQDIVGLGIKTIDYEYHPITGLATKVVYQKGNSTEQFIHRYTYNEIYQLVKVETSTDNINYTLHAEYSYYETGEMKRTELAGGIQGVDYVYNLNGQLKGINHPGLNANQDPGRDDNDLFGMQIDYHNADYKRALDNIKARSYGTNQLNGNIKGIRWNNSILSSGGSQETVYSYNYNRNNWLTDATYGTFNGNSSIDANLVKSNSYSSTDGTVQLEATQSITFTDGFHAVEGTILSGKIVAGSGFREVNDGDYNVTGITYDANGNIKTLNRNKHTENGSNVMDALTYTYKTDKPNQLLRVDDAITDNTNADDIKDQNGSNYIYNEIGQLVQNNEEGITYIYNTSGLVTEVQKNNLSIVKFFYNDRNHRIKKESFSSNTGDLQNTTFYVRDVAGSIISIYTKTTTNSPVITEQNIYGANRLGIFNRQNNTNVYQLTDHLGNVRAVFAKINNSLETRGGNDYYPFGMAMPAKNSINANTYRYAFQGQEKDPETGKEAFELRLWDSRIGRWLTIDPYRQFNSPYLGMGNNPINGIDPDGGLFGRLRAKRYARKHGGSIYKSKKGKWNVVNVEFSEEDGFVVTTKNFGYGGLGKFTWKTTTAEIEGKVDAGIQFVRDKGAKGVSAKLLTADFLTFKTNFVDPNGDLGIKNSFDYFLKDGKVKGSTLAVKAETSKLDLKAGIKYEADDWEILRMPSVVAPFTAVPKNFSAKAEYGVGKPFFEKKIVLSSNRDKIQIHFGLQEEWSKSYGRYLAIAGKAGFRLQGVIDWEF
ncbi:hypothetical protein GTQ40_17790 [Flavobacteriaceae bacterium R38]|nr:hypothetical protein [Flavobacteriaceae bacterium R38]